MTKTLASYLLLNKSIKNFLPKTNVTENFLKKNISTKFWVKKQNLLQTTKQKTLASILNFKKCHQIRYKKNLPGVLYRKLKKNFGIKRYNRTKFKISDKIENLFKFNLTILVKKNNVFCTFSNFEEKKTIKACSSETYKIKVSKKTLRYTYDLVLDKFYRDIKKQVYKNKKKFFSRKNGVFVTLVCSKILRKKVLKSIRRNFKKTPLLIKVLNKKIFNGCRPPKKVRKKRRRMRIYK